MISGFDPDNYNVRRNTDNEPGVHQIRGTATLSASVVYQRSPTVVGRVDVSRLDNSTCAGHICWLRNQCQRVLVVSSVLDCDVISLVVVSILSGVTQQQLLTKNNVDKNAAILLAEMRMEELMKFPAGQLMEETYYDYILLKDGKFDISLEGAPDPLEERQFRRTTVITKDLLQQLATIRVIVDYGAVYTSRAGTAVKYPFRVFLVSRRMTK